jgi:predicted metal-dependent hydrolase
MNYLLSEKRDFVFGKHLYCYALIRQERKTLGLTVTPELQIIVKCPLKTKDERIELFLKKKWFWLEKQLNFFKKFQRKMYKKEYLSGEGVLYLGRQYKLIVKKSDSERVQLLKGQVVVYVTKKVDDGEATKKLLNGWFREKMQKIFAERYDEMVKRFDYKSFPKLQIREMQKRWGSFLKDEKIYLNPRLIHVSKECIDYVIVHELCHVKYKNHNKKFFDHLNEKHPKWELIKERLELCGIK